jgi:hypothetical protein
MTSVISTIGVSLLTPIGLGREHVCVGGAAKVQKTTTKSSLKLLQVLTAAAGRPVKVKVKIMIKAKVLTHETPASPTMLLATRAVRDRSRRNFSHFCMSSGPHRTRLM